MPLLKRRRAPMTHVVGRKRTRVAVSPLRRKRGQAAVERMRGWHDHQTVRCPHGTDWLGNCAHSVACAFNRYASGWNAVDGWRQTPAKYRHTGRKSTMPPRGALVFWSGGSHGYGHVGVANGRGRFWGVDLPVSGHIGLADIGEPARRWGLSYLGWCWADQVAGW